MTKKLLASLAVAVLIAAVPAAAKQKPKAAPTLKDLEGRKVEVNPGQAVQASPEKAMENYKAFIDLNSGDPALRAEALRRLGDLNLESSEIERAEKEQVASQGPRGAEAIKLYKTLLETYPNYPGADAVLYQLARAYESDAKGDPALSTLDQLVKRFPQSRLIDEAQFRRGEILFSAQRYADAEQAYANVVRRGAQSTFYEQSLYKQGWSQFKLARSDDSLDAFGRLFDRKLVDAKNPRAAVDLKTLSRPERELVDDAFRVVSIIFSDLDGPQSADAFVKRRGAGATAGPPYAWLVYSHLGDLYIEKERYQDAALTYESFVKLNPVDANAPLLQVRAIEAYRKGGFSSLVIEGKQDFVERYGFGAAFWNGRDRKDFPAVVAELKTGVMELAKHSHAAAQKQKAEAAKTAAGAKLTADAKARADYQQAARWYRSYLEWFPNEAESADTNFLLAEALFESRQYQDAAAEYERTAYRYPAHSHSAEAAYAALLAYDAYDKQLSAGASAQTGAGAGAGWHARAIDSSLKFAAAYPTHKEVPVVLTRTAKELFEAHDLDRAVATAEQVLALQPPVDSDKRRTALTVIAHSRFDQDRFAQAETAYLQLRQVVPAGDKEQAAITEKLAAAVYKQAEEKKAAGDANGAVADFLRVAQVAPNSAIRKNADYDAAAALVALKDWPRAIAVLEAFRRNHPQDPLTADATRSLAVGYLETQQLGHAAVEFERIADESAQSSGTASSAAADGASGATRDTADAIEVRRDALWRAAELYQKTNDRPAATHAYEKFVTRFPGAFDPAIEARQRLADMAADANDFKTRDRWLKEIVTADADAAGRRTDRSHYLAAKATLLFAHPTGDAFGAVKLALPLKKTLALKKQAMERALDAYGKAAQYGVAEVTTEATYSMAELYRTLAKDLMASERPKTLKTEEEKEEYTVLLKEQTFPFEEKAIEIHEANTARTKENVYDEGVKKSFHALAQLKPGRYAKTEIGAETLPAQSAALTQEELTLKVKLAQSPANAPARDFAPAQGSVNTPAPDPATASVQTRLGTVYRKLGRFKEAEAAYQEAVKADPAYAPAYLNLGVLFDLYLQEPARAMEAYQRYQQLSVDADGVASGPSSGTPGAPATPAVANWIAELKGRLGSNPQPAGEGSP